MIRDNSSDDENELSKPTESRVEFADEFAAIDSHSRGSWGERAVLNEADVAGHVVLIDHVENPTKQGFDCASFDPQNSELHVWEVKNWDSRPVDSHDLSSWRTHTTDGERRNGYERNWQELIDSVPEGAARDAVREAVNEGRVTFHLRLGPETDLTPRLQKELEEAKVPGSNYDWKRYSHEEMMRLRR